MTTPIKNPTTVLAVLDLKKDPWPQSWKMMNSLIKNSEANAHKAKVSGQEIDIVKYIATHKPIKGIPELISCQIAFPSEGF